MTREKFLTKWRYEIKDLGDAYDLIDQIFDEHEAQLKAKDKKIERLREELKYHEAELEALQQPKNCDGCWYGKTTINSVICGKNGTYKEADDYCNYYNPK